MNSNELRAKLEAFKRRFYLRYERLKSWIRIVEFSLHCISWRLARFFSDLMNQHLAPAMLMKCVPSVEFDEMLKWLLHKKLHHISITEMVTKGKAFSELSLKSR